MNASAPQVDVINTTLLPMPGLLFGLYLPIDGDGNVHADFAPRAVVIQAQRHVDGIVTLVHDGPDGAPLVLYDGSGDKSRLQSSVQPTFAGFAVYPSQSSASARLEQMHRGIRSAYRRLQTMNQLQIVQDNTARHLL